MEEPITNERISEDQKRLKDLFYLSFRYSQGGPSLQGDIFQWLAKTGEIDEKLRNEIEKCLEPPIYITRIQVPKKHVEVPVKGVRNPKTPEAEIRDMWASLRTMALSDKLKSETEIRKDILYEMVKRDLEFQWKARAGRDAKLMASPDDEHDPHASFIRRYILSNKFPGHEAFDKMFDELGELFVDIHKNKENIKDLGFTESTILVSMFSLQEKWEGNHPGFSFFPAEWLEKINEPS